MPDNPPAGDIIGHLLGPYRLLQLIGEGGMGEVYLAERENEFRKRVAIKLIRAGMANEDVIRRFVMERHLLASLNHPNIVRLVDGGATDTGLPYLVVDYVEGIPIDAYCDRHKLSIKERLRLFADVCLAVHHAHKSLIIHCDLKPGNILVTPEGTPMLLDFGIAKLVNPVALGMETQTLTRLRAYTPRYASPEQLRGEPLTTACDVYALGVIFYELLSGQSPYRVGTSGSIVEWVRSVCDEESDAPSIAVQRASATTATEPRHLQGDLDAIALKALRKDPRERYGSVDQLAEDIRRHLSGLPVLARRNTAGYVTRKFLQRHKFSSLAVALLLISLSAGVAATLWQARIAARRFDDVRHLAHAFLFDIHDSIQNLPGSTEARALIARTGAEYLDRLARDSRGNTALELDLAQGFLKIGDVEGNPFDSNLGDTAKAIDNYNRALALAERPRPGNKDAREVLAKVHLRLSSVLPFRNRSKEALPHATKALQLYRELSAAQPNDPELRLALSHAWEAQGDVQGGMQSVSLGQPEEALKSYREALAAIPDVPTLHVSYDRTGRAKAVVMSKIADMISRNGETLAAQGIYRSALAIAEGLLQRHPQDTAVQSVLTAVLNRLAASESGMNDAIHALEHYRRSSAISEAALSADPKNERARSNVVVAQKNMGDVYYYLLQDMSQALAWYRTTAILLDQLVQSDPKNGVWTQHLSEVLTDIASCLIAVGKPQDARAPAERGLALAKEIADRPGATMDQIYNYAWLAVSVDPESLRNPAAALPYAQKAVDLSRGENAMCLHVLAQAQAGTGKLKEAIATDEKALALYPPTPPGKPTAHNRAVIERALERYRKSPAPAK